MSTILKIMLVTKW